VAANDPAERSELARLAVLTRWAKTADRTAATKPARDALIAKFDPGPEVPEPQRTKMIEAGLKAHMIRMRRARRKAENLADEIVAESGEAATS
jgi:hypothetical protein